MTKHAQTINRPQPFPDDRIIKPNPRPIKRNEKGQIVGDTPGNRFPKAEITSLTKLIKDYTRHNPSKAYRLIARLYELGIQGNMMAIQTILERHDGKVTDKIEMDVRPIALEFVPAESLLLTTTTTIVDQPSQLQIQSSTQGTEDKDPG
jgi:hypothetical protein